MSDSRDGREAERARKRIANALRSAMPLRDDAAIEADIQRLMLHLSCEPYDSMIPMHGEPQSGERSREMNGTSRQK